MPTRAHSLPDLGDYRDARHRRLSLTTALWSLDSDRALLLPELTEFLAVARADRVGVVWLDEFEYYVERVYAYAVLDLGNDRPDRSFPWEPLVQAFQLGVPGLVDIGGPETAARSSRPLVAVTLGSDGARLWLLVADAATPRPWLSPVERERALHIAGRCSGMVLHSDLGPQTGVRGLSRPSEPMSTFAGAQLLRDLRDPPRPTTKKEEELLCSRFEVARLVAPVVEAGGVFPAHLGGQVRTTRRRLAESADRPSEASAWDAVLDALEAGNLRALCEATLAMAHRADAVGHRWSGAQLCWWSYDVAVVLGSADAAAAAAGAMAAACGELSDHEAARRWARGHRRLMLALDDAPVAEPPV
jgi:hypothetical protein